MKIIEIKNLEKKDIPLHYRNEFRGSLVYETNMSGMDEKPFEFIVERSATGKLDIQIQLPEQLNYPLIPALRSLKVYIQDMDKKGLLV